MRTLPIGQPQRILELRSIDTQYGRAVIAELEDVIVFLPQRMRSLTDQQLRTFNEMNYTMTVTEHLIRTVNVVFDVIEFEPKLK